MVNKEEIIKFLRYEIAFIRTLGEFYDLPFDLTLPSIENAVILLHRLENNY